MIATDENFTAGKSLGYVSKPVAGGVGLEQDIAKDISSVAVRYGVGVAVQDERLVMLRPMLTPKPGMRGVGEESVQQMPISSEVVHNLFTSAQQAGQ